MTPTKTVTWQDGTLRILDQTLLPNQVKEIELSSREAVWEAIKTLRVRGAPAIGVCAAYGVLVGMAERHPKDTAGARAQAVETMRYLAGARPTAVNLFYALDRMERCAARHNDDTPLEVFCAALEAEATALFTEDVAMCKAIGHWGAPLILADTGVLTHCNAGGLATSGYGTALAPMYAAHAQGRRFKVFADETRPLLQGARLTAWELREAGIDVTLICDNMAASVMREGRIHCVIVGADRIATNGDTANKIGTYGVAALAGIHGIPVYVAAPASTFDPNLADGAGIPIEQRDPREVTHWREHPAAPAGISVYNPAFDVTPAAMITAFITDRGLLYPPFDAAIATILQD